MKPTLLILVGPPASGKSTYAKQLVKENEGWIRLCRDDFRLMWKSSQLMPKELESFLTTIIINTLIENSLSINKNVVIDATNCKEGVLDKWIKDFSRDYSVKFKFFNNFLDNLYTRNMLRTDDKVPAKIIKNMYENYSKIDQSQYDKI